MNRSLFATPFLLLALAASAMAQPAAAPRAAPNAAEEADHEALRQLKTIYETAVNENKLEMLEPHLHADFSGVMLTSEEVSSFADIKSYWAKIQGMMGEGGRYTVEIVPERSAIEGDFAIARGSTKDVVVDGRGSEFTFSSYWTAVCQKDATGAWKIRRIQGTMDPIGNPFVIAAISASTILTAGVAGLIGLAIGLIIMLVLRKKKA